MTDSPTSKRELLKALHSVHANAGHKFDRDTALQAIEFIERLAPEPAASLEDKLALMIWYLEEVRQRRRSSDPKGFEALLDDTEVSTWLDKMNKAGRIRNTRFTQTRNS